MKTHNGVRTEFDRLTRDDRDIPDDLRGFLAKAYQLKSIADYGIDPDIDVSANQASTAIVAARVFVAMCRQLLDRPAP